MGRIRCTPTILSLTAGLLLSASTVRAEPADIAAARTDCATGIHRIDYSKVTEACERILKWSAATKRDRATALLYLGWMQNNTFKREKAIEYWQSAIAADDAYIEPRLALGLHHSLFGNFEKALESLFAAEKLDDKDWRVFSGKARAYLWSNRQLEALRESQHAILLEPEMPEPHILRAMAFERLGAFDQAIAHYALAVRYWNSEGSYSPGNWREEHPAIALAQAYHVSGNPAAAFDTINDYMNALPDRQTFFDMFAARATYLEALGRVSEAAEDLQKAALRAPEFERPNLLSKRDALLLLARGPAKSDSHFEDIMSKATLNTVLRVQVYLRNAGIHSVGITGVYDEATRDGLRECLSNNDCGKKLGSRI